MRWKDRIVQICANCGAPCPFTWVNGERIWDASKPCEKCGEKKWAAHDVLRNWKTGKLLDGAESD